MICAIHQPNFFPWLGYFDKMHRSDKFVFLDQVSYPKSSKTMSTWGNRVAVNIMGEKKWIHCPLIREDGVQYFDKIKIDNTANWRDKVIKTLSLNYKKSDYFDEVFDYICELIRYDADELGQYNIHTITSLLKRLNIACVWERQSDLNTVNHSNELLIEIVRKEMCDQYMCGGGADGYQDVALFQKQKIEVIYQNYNPIPYKQCSENFVGGLSVIDALFCCGFEGTENLIKQRSEF